MMFQSEGFRSSKTFFVGPGEEESVYLANKKGQIACEYKYKSKRNDKVDASPHVSQYQPLHRDVETMLGKISGLCIRKTYDYWKYEVCFDSRITQSHGRESYTIGTYSGMTKNQHLYKDGTLCEALGGKSGREARVEFVCDQALRLISVEEVSTCSYKIYVTTPVVCGHPDFLQSRSSIPGANGGSGKSGPPKDEWFLELMQLADGQLSCSASALQISSVIEFDSFQLALVSTKEATVTLNTQKDVVRCQGRTHLKKNLEYKIKRVNGGTTVQIQSTSSFKGFLSYVNLQTVPQEQVVD